MNLPLLNSHPSDKFFSGVTPPARSIFSQTIPTATVSALGAVGDDLLARKRGAYFEVEGDGASECEHFTRAIERFAGAANRLTFIPDLQLYKQVDELIAQAGRTVRTIHSFASQFCDPQDSMSKYLLLKAIEQLIGELYTTYGELTVKEEAVARVRSEAKPLEPPELPLSDRAKVLKRSRSSATSAARRAEDSEDLTLSHGAHYKVASVVTHSPQCNPHDHLLVESNYVVSSGGLLQRIPLHPRSATHDKGLSITLGFEGCITGPLCAQLPGYAISKISYRNRSGSEVQVREGEHVFSEAKPPSSRSVATTVVTYQQVNGKERNPTSQSRLDRAELCTPEKNPARVIFEKKSLAIAGRAQSWRSQVAP